MPAETGCDHQPYPAPRCRTTRRTTSETRRPHRPPPVQPTATTLVASLRSGGPLTRPHTRPPSRPPPRAETITAASATNSLAVCVPIQSGMAGTTRKRAREHEQSHNGSPARTTVPLRPRAPVAPHSPRAHDRRAVASIACGCAVSLASPQLPHLCPRCGEPSSRRTRSPPRDVRRGCMGTLSGGGGGTAAVTLPCQPLGGALCAPRRPTAPATPPPCAWRQRRFTRLSPPCPLTPPSLTCCHPPGREAATAITMYGDAAAASLRGHAGRCQAGTGSCRDTHGWHADPTPLILRQTPLPAARHQQVTM